MAGPQNDSGRGAGAAHAPAPTGIVLSEEEKRGVALFGIALLLLLAFAVVVYDYISPHTGAGTLPEQCSGYPTTSQNYYSCVSGLAITSRNISRCALLQTGEENACILNYSESTLDAGACGYLGATSLYYRQCIQYISVKSDSIQLCGRLVGQQALNCIYNVSSASGFVNVSACSSLVNNSYKTECMNLDYYNDALASNTPSLCGNLQDRVNGTTLYYLTSGPAQANRSVELFFLAGSLNVSPRALCYYNIALATGNATVCGRITGNFSKVCSYSAMVKNESRMSFNLSAANVSAACGHYTGYPRTECYYRYLLSQSISENSATPCLALNQSETSSCLFQLAINKSDGAFCSGIQNATVKAVCDLEENVTANATA